MALTLEVFAARCRAALLDQPGPAGRARVNDLVREALHDPQFIAACIPEGTPERHVLHEDQELGFAILAHAYARPKASGPHDHGPTWAIYGQAEGETMMTDWEVLEPASAERHGRAIPSRDYTLRPGDAHLYEPGAVHSPRRDGPTKLLRIEGMNTDRVKRYPYDAVQTAG